MISFQSLISGEGSRLIAAGDYNVGLLINVLFAILIGSFSIAQLTPRIQSFISATSAAQKVFQTIRRIPSIDSLDEGGLRPDLKGDIHFTDVSFIYPSRPQGNRLNFLKVNKKSRFSRMSHLLFRRESSPLLLDHLDQENRLLSIYSNVSTTPSQDPSLSTDTI